VGWFAHWIKLSLTAGGSLQNPPIGCLDAGLLKAELSPPVRPRPIPCHEGAGNGNLTRGSSVLTDL